MSWRSHAVIDLRDPKKPVQASYRGDALIYPASVIKLFYLTAAHRWMEDKKIEDTAELRKNMRDMIVDSSNVATHYIIDDITGTTSGPELPDEGDQSVVGKTQCGDNGTLRRLGLQEY